MKLFPYMVKLQNVTEMLPFMVTHDKEFEVLLYIEVLPYMVKVLFMAELPCLKVPDYTMMWYYLYQLMYIPGYYFVEITICIIETKKRAIFIIQWRKYDIIPCICYLIG